MALMIIAGEKYDMPIWLKARLLQVTETEDANVLDVESGSERGKSYPVRHNGKHATFCPCRATIDECAHVLAVNRHLEDQQAQAQNELDEAAVVAETILGKDDAQDLQAHLQDEMPAQDVPVFMDHDGYYGRVRVDGKVEELPVSEISRRWPNYRVVTHREFYGAFPTKADLEKCSLPQGFSLLA